MVRSHSFSHHSFAVDIKLVFSIPPSDNQIPLWITACLASISARINTSSEAQLIKNQVVVHPGQEPPLPRTQHLTHKESQKYWCHTGQRPIIKNTPLFSSNWFSLGCILHRKHFSRVLVKTHACRLLISVVSNVIQKVLL